MTLNRIALLTDLLTTGSKSQLRVRGAGGAAARQKNSDTNGQFYAVVI
jgi:hypothetical protein